MTRALAANTEKQRLPARLWVMTQLVWLAAGLVALAAPLTSPRLQADETEAVSQSEELTSEEIAEIETRIQQQLSEPSSSEISLEKGSQLAELLTTDQPAWLTIPSEQFLISHKRAVASDLFFSEQACDKSLGSEMSAAVRDYINAYLGDENAAMLVHVDDEYIRKNLVSDQFDEVWDVKQFGKQMHRQHALLDFSESFRELLDSKWSDVVQTSKLLTTGLGAGGLLGLLGIAFAYLRLDSATKGYYSGRLQFLAGAAILALAAAGTLFAKLNEEWLRWM